MKNLVLNILYFIILLTSSTTSFSYPLKINGSILYKNQAPPPKTRNVINVSIVNFKIYIHLAFRLYFSLFIIFKVILNSFYYSLENKLTLIFRIQVPYLHYIRTYPFQDYK